MKVVLWTAPSSSQRWSVQTILRDPPQSRMGLIGGPNLIHYVSFGTSALAFCRLSSFIQLHGNFQRPPRPCHIVNLMTRGNQREQDRLKAQKKAAAASKGKPKQSQTSLANRREQDAEIIRQKMAVRTPPYNHEPDHVLTLLIVLSPKLLVNQREAMTPIRKRRASSSSRRLMSPGAFVFS